MLAWRVPFHPLDCQSPFWRTQGQNIAVASRCIMWSPTKKSINTSYHIFSLTMFDHVWQSTNYHHQQQHHHQQQQHQHEHQHHQQSCLTYWQSTNINKRSSSRFPEPSRGFLTDLLEAFVLGEAREHLVGTFHEESIAIWRLYGGSMEVPTIYGLFFRPM